MRKDSGLSGKFCQTWLQHAVFWECMECGGSPVGMVSGIWEPNQHGHPATVENGILCPRQGGWNPTTQGATKKNITGKVTGCISKGCQLKNERRYCRLPFLTFCLKEGISSCNTCFQPKNGKPTDCIFLQQRSRSGLLVFCTPVENAAQIRLKFPYPHKTYTLKSQES